MAAKLLLGRTPPLSSSAAGGRGEIPAPDALPAPAAPGAFPLSARSV